MPGFGSGPFGHHTPTTLDMDPKDLPVDYTTLLPQQAVQDVSSIPDAPSKVAELFKLFEVAAKSVVLGGNVELKKPSVKKPSSAVAASYKFDTSKAIKEIETEEIQAALIQAEEKAEAVAAEMKEDAKPFPKEQEDKKVSVPKKGTTHHGATPMQLSQAMKDLLTPAALEALEAKMAGAAKVVTTALGHAQPPSVDEDIPNEPLPASTAWVPPSVQTKQAQVSKALLKLGFTADLAETLSQSGAPPAVTLALCELVLQNVKQVEKKAKVDVLSQNAQALADYKAHTDKILHQFQKETAAAKKEAAETKAQQLDVVQKAVGAWKDLAEKMFKDLHTEKDQTLALQSQLNDLLTSTVAPVPPTTVEAAFEGIAQSFRDVWKARMYYVELAVAKLMEEDEKEPVWPTLPVSWHAGYGCPGCSANQTMVGVSHPKQGNGFTCSKCKKTWKDPNAPKSQGKKAFFDRITAVKTLVEELGYDLDMALYLVDTAGAQRVLHIAQQVPSVPAPYLAEFKEWSNEQNGVGAPKKPPLSAVETLTKATAKQEAIAQIEKDLAADKVWNVPAPEVTSNVQVLKYTPEALAKEVQAQSPGTPSYGAPGSPSYGVPTLYPMPMPMPPLSSAYEALKHTYEHLQAAAKAGFYVNTEKLKTLEQGLADQEALEDGLTSGMLAYNVHDELIPVSSLKESNPQLAKIAAELLMSQAAAPEAPLVVAATPLEVAKFNQPASSPVVLDAILNSLAEDEALDALALIPVASKKKSKK